MKPTTVALSVAALGVVGYFAYTTMKSARGASAVQSSVLRSVAGGHNPGPTKASAAGNLASGLKSTLGQAGGSLLSSWVSSRNTGTSPPPDLSSIKGLF